MNNLGRWIDPRIRAVRVADVRSYLEARGWRSRPYPLPELLVFEGPPDDAGRPIVQVLPSSESLADYPQRVIELITALSVIEDRPPVEVLDDVLRQSSRDQSPDANGPRRTAEAKSARKR